MHQRTTTEAASDIEAPRWKVRLIAQQTGKFSPLEAIQIYYIIYPETNTSCPEKTGIMNSELLIINATLYVHVMYGH